MDFVVYLCALTLPLHVTLAGFVPTNCAIVNPRTNSQRRPTCQNGDVPYMQTASNILSCGTQGTMSDQACPMGYKCEQILHFTGCCKTPVRRRPVTEVEGNVVSPTQIQNHESHVDQTHLLPLDSIPSPAIVSIIESNIESIDQLIDAAVSNDLLSTSGGPSPQTSTAPSVAIVSEENAHSDSSTIEPVTTLSVNILQVDSNEDKQTNEHSSSFQTGLFSFSNFKNTTTLAQNTVNITRNHSISSEFRNSFETSKNFSTKPINTTNTELKNSITASSHPSSIVVQQSSDGKSTFESFQNSKNFQTIPQNNNNLVTDEIISGESLSTNGLNTEDSLTSSTVAEPRFGQTDAKFLTSNVVETEFAKTTVPSSTAAETIKITDTVNTSPDQATQLNHFASAESTSRKGFQGSTNVVGHAGTATLPVDINTFPTTSSDNVKATSAALTGVTIEPISFSVAKISEIQGTTQQIILPHETISVLSAESSTPDDQSKTEAPIMQTRLPETIENSHVTTSHPMLNTDEASMETVVSNSQNQNLVVDLNSKSNSFISSKVTKKSNNILNSIAENHVSKTIDGKISTQSVESLSIASPIPSFSPQNIDTTTSSLPKSPEQATPKDISCDETLSVLTVQNQSSLILTSPDVNPTELTEHFIATTPINKVEVTQSSIDETVDLEISTTSVMRINSLATTIAGDSSHTLDAALVQSFNSAGPLSKFSSAVTEIGDLFTTGSDAVDVSGEAETSTSSPDEMPRLVTPSQVISSFEITDSMQNFVEESQEAENSLELSRTTSSNNNIELTTVNDATVDEASISNINSISESETLTTKTSFQSSIIAKIDESVEKISGQHQILNVIEQHFTSVNSSTSGILAQNNTLLKNMSSSFNGVANTTEATTLLVEPIMIPSTVATTFLTNNENTVIQEFANSSIIATIKPETTHIPKNEVIDNVPLTEFDKFTELDKGFVTTEAPSVATASFSQSFSIPVETTTEITSSISQRAFDSSHSNLFSTTSKFQQSEDAISTVLDNVSAGIPSISSEPGIFTENSVNTEGPMMSSFKSSTNAHMKLLTSPSQLVSQTTVAPEPSKTASSLHDLDTSSDSVDQTESNPISSKSTTIEESLKKTISNISKTVDSINSTLRVSIESEITLLTRAEAIENVESTDLVEQSGASDLVSQSPLVSASLFQASTKGLAVESTEDITQTVSSVPDQALNPSTNAFLPIVFITSTQNSMESSEAITSTPSSSSDETNNTESTSLLRILSKTLTSDSLETTEQITGTVSSISDRSLSSISNPLLPTELITEKPEEAISFDSGNVVFGVTTVTFQPDDITEISSNSKRSSLFPAITSTIGQRLPTTSLLQSTETSITTEDVLFSETSSGITESMERSISIATPTTTETSDEISNNLVTQTTKSLPDTDVMLKINLTITSNNSEEGLPQTVKQTGMESMNISKNSMDTVSDKANRSLFGFPISTETLIITTDIKNIKNHKNSENETKIEMINRIKEKLNNKRTEKQMTGDTDDGASVLEIERGWVSIPPNIPIESLIFASKISEKNFTQPTLFFNNSHKLSKEILEDFKITSFKTASTRSSKRRPIDTSYKSKTLTASSQLNQYRGGSIGTVIAKQSSSITGVSNQYFGNQINTNGNYERIATETFGENVESQYSNSESGGNKAVEGDKYNNYQTSGKQSGSEIDRHESIDVSVRTGNFQISQSTSDGEQESARRGTWRAGENNKAASTASITFSCGRRYPYKQVCGNGRFSQFTIRWFFKDGKCCSYPWGHCKNDELAFEVSLRTKEECEKICIQGNVPQGASVDQGTSNPNGYSGSDGNINLIPDSDLSCERLPFRGTCSDGSRSQFTIRWFYMHGKCCSYPWGHCKGDDIAFEPAIRSKSLCEKICNGRFQGRFLT